jgi:DNA-binding transcriptional ArsR family regulator
MISVESKCATPSSGFPVSRQAVVKHLAVLDEAGLVHGTKSGREMRYAVQPDRLEAAARWMARVAAEWDTRLAAIKRIAESATHTRSKEP